MKSINAIALVFVKSLSRSGFLAVITVFLTVSSILLPLTVKGDGTLDGTAGLIIYYNLALASALLGIVSLWASCGAISQEISDKQIQLIVCKPVNGLQIWMGKWTGIMLVNTVLLLVAVVITFGTVTLFSKSSKFSPDIKSSQQASEVLSCRRKIVPKRPDIKTEAKKIYEKMRSDGKIPDETQLPAVMAELAKQIYSARFVVPTNASLYWNITIPRDGIKACQAFRSDILSESPVFLRFRFDVPGRDLRKASGEWSFFDNNNTKIYTTNITTALEGIHSVVLPCNTIPSDGNLKIAFKNGSSETSRTLVFHETEGIEILIRESSFGANMARSTLVILSGIALLCALGLTAGSLFSFPVATFTACALTLAVIGSHFFTSNAGSLPEYDHHGAPINSKPIDKIGEYVMKTIEIVAAPALDFKPISAISSGTLIPWHETLKAALIRFVVYSLVLGMIGGGVLSRRQLALPHT